MLNNTGCIGSSNAAQRKRVILLDICCLILSWTSPDFSNWLDRVIITSNDVAID